MICILNSAPLASCTCRLQVCHQKHCTVSLDRMIFIALQSMPKYGSKYLLKLSVLCYKIFATPMQWNQETPSNHSLLLAFPQQNVESINFPQRTYNGVTGRFISLIYLYYIIFLRRNCLWCGLFNFLDWFAGLCLGCCEHTILHQSTVESTMHPLKTITISQTLEVLLGLKDKSSGIVYSNPNGMTPRCNCWFIPVCSRNFIHETSCINNILVLLNRNEVRVGPVEM